MTPRSLFLIIIKIFGLIFLKEIIVLILQLISMLIINIGTKNMEAIIFTLLSTIIGLAFCFFILYKLFIDTHMIIDKLKLDEGFFEENFSIKFSAMDVFKMAIIIIGGMLIVFEIPNLIMLLVTFFRNKSIPFLFGKNGLDGSIASVIKILLGLTVIGERNRIAALVAPNKLDEDSDLNEEN